MSSTDVYDEPSDAKFSGLQIRTTLGIVARREGVLGCAIFLVGAWAVRVRGGVLRDSVALEDFAAFVLLLVYLSPHVFLNLLTCHYTTQSIRIKLSAI